MLGYDFLQNLSDAQSQTDTDLVSVNQSRFALFELSACLLIYYLQTTHRPIVIVCHSLGGIVVKQALCVANKQFPRYGSIVNAIAGVIFLSTPHRYGSHSTK